MAKASTFIANIFGGIGFFVVFIAICCPMEQSRLKMLACCFFLATLFQGLTLLIFASNVCKEGFFASYFPSLNGENPVLSNIVQSVSCSLDTGSQLAVSATALYFVCILLVQTAVAPKPIGLSDSDEDTPAPAAEGDAEEQPVA
jgi:Trk-type K+ transport system membrane component